MWKCRPGQHDFPCGTTKTGDIVECDCGCSPSDWCTAQGQYVTDKNWKPISERLGALFLTSLVRELGPDERVEFDELKENAGSYLKRRTTHDKA